MIIEFPAPAKLLNLNDRSHWSKKAPIVAEWRRTAWAYGIHSANTFQWKTPLRPATV